MENRQSTRLSVRHSGRWPEEEPIENVLAALHEWRGHSGRVPPHDPGGGRYRRSPFICKNHPIGALYAPDLARCTLPISFMTVAGLDRWAIQFKWGPTRRVQKAEPEKHVNEIRMVPHPEGNRGHYIAEGGWNLLG